MANVTDPLALMRGNIDPQNLMEYIVRQKVYDSRFWKEECFGLSAADVLEKAATTLQCVGGTFGGNRRPTKFICLVLKLLQLQPELELVEQFIHQDHFKYVKALGCFYLRMTGRPHEIYEVLEPQYRDYSKLRYRDVTDWKLLHMDEFIDELLHKSNVCGIALPRLPARTTLQEAGYLLEDENADDNMDVDDNNNNNATDELFRPTELKEAIQVAGGIEAYLKYKVDVEKSPAAIALWNQRHGISMDIKEREKKKTITKDESPIAVDKNNNNNNNIKNAAREIAETAATNNSQPNGNDKKRKSKSSKKKKKKKKRKYGTLFKDGAASSSDDDDSSISGSSDDDERLSKRRKKERPKRSEGTSADAAAPVVEGSEEYWNLEREKLGLKPLRK